MDGLNRERERVKAFVLKTPLLAFVFGLSSFDITESTFENNSKILFVSLDHPIPDTSAVQFCGPNTL